MFSEVILQDFRDTFVSKGVVYLRMCRASTVVLSRACRASTVVPRLDFQENQLMIQEPEPERSDKNLGNRKVVGLGH